MSPTWRIALLLLVISCVDAAISQHHWRNLYRQINTDGSRLTTRSEFEYYLRHVRHEQNASSMAQCFYDAYDWEGNDRMCMSEWQRTYIKVRRQFPECPHLYNAMFAQRR